MLMYLPVSLQKPAQSVQKLRWSIIFYVVCMWTMQWTPSHKNLYDITSLINTHHYGNLITTMVTLSPHSAQWQIIMKTCNDNHFNFKNLNLIISKNNSIVLHCSEHYFILQQASTFNQTILYDCRQHSDKSNSNLTGVIHKENPTRCNSASKFYFVFIWSSTCFERHTAHYQEPKFALAASGFACVEGCWTCSC